MRQDAETKREQRGKEEKESEMIRWQGFLLIKNKAYRKFYNFYCGKCEIGYAQIIDFLDHCLFNCNEIMNPLSSHTIMDDDKL